MVEPTNFYTNEETYKDNKFMNKVSADAKATTEQAMFEFHHLVRKIILNHVDVEVFKQSDPNAPDSIFPNNWFSTHGGEDFPRIFCIFKIII